MNQTKVLEIKKYLLRHLENHLHNKQSAVSIGFKEQFSTQLRQLQKLDQAARKAFDTYNQSKIALVSELKKVNDKLAIQGGLNSGYSSGDLEIYLSESTVTFATINSREYYQCSKTLLPTARQAAADIDHFCLTVMLDGDISDVEAFKTNLLRNI